MENIQLLYVKNVISRKDGFPRQELDFAILVKNLAYEKKVEIHWAGEDGIWQILNAQYDSPAGECHEYWHAQARFLLSTHSLPGNIQFALHLQAEGKVYWDNNLGNNYRIDADSGVIAGPGIDLLSLERGQIIPCGQKVYPITVAVRSPKRPKHVMIHWTKDNWKKTRVTPCIFKRNYWDKTIRSNARNPNRYEYGIWTCHLRIGKAYRVEYAVECDWEDSSLWDNNFGTNYLIHRGRLKILTLNLHCYQEAEQDHKFSLIAQAINDLAIDIVCLQEVGSPWEGGQGNWQRNAAEIINGRLSKPYHVYADWSHLGFGQYQEGVAILSKFPIANSGSRYVSEKKDIYDIHSRKVLLGQIFVPWLGIINVFCAHLSWWEDGFEHQFENLRRWANESHTNNIAATLLCGDFNIKAGSQGYSLMVNTQEYEDQFLAATAHGTWEKIFKRQEKGWEEYLASDPRIDYIFMKKDAQIQVVAAKPIFTESDYGHVSDHIGYYMEFEPKSP